MVSLWSACEDIVIICCRTYHARLCLETHHLPRTVQQGEIVEQQEPPTPGLYVLTHRSVLGESAISRQRVIVGKFWFD